jgi:hypothetical protein
VAPDGSEPYLSCPWRRWHLLFIDDLAKWDRALRDHTLLSDAEMQPALDSSSTKGRPSEIPQRIARDPYQDRQNQVHRRMSHNGDTIGFQTTIQRFPDEKLTIIVLANRVDINPEELALKVADLYLGTKL